MEPPPRTRGRLGPRVATVLLLLLALIAFLGTLAAAQAGVLAARARYFDVLVAWQPLGAGLAVPLPGAKLLLLALFATLVLDRSAWSLRPGRRALPVVHAGVALLLGSGLWSAWAGREWTGEVAVGGALRELAPAFELPFGLRLRAVHRAYHPRTDVPARLEAELDVEPPDQPPYRAHITLHEPLHRAGVAVHLRGDPAGMLPPAAPVQLVLQHDPARPLRLLACVLLGLGLLAHFAGALCRHLRRRAA